MTNAWLRGVPLGHAAVGYLGRAPAVPPLPAPPAVIAHYTAEAAARLAVARSDGDHECGADQLGAGWEMTGSGTTLINRLRVLLFTTGDAARDCRPATIGSPGRPDRPGRVGVDRTRGHRCGVTGRE